MAVLATEINGHPVSNKKKVFLLDTADEILRLPRVGVEGTLDAKVDPDVNEPCSYGSEATVVDPFGGYILSPSNVWKQVF